MSSSYQQLFIINTLNVSVAIYKFLFTCWQCYSKSVAQRCIFNKKSNFLSLQVNFTYLYNMYRCLHTYFLLKVPRQPFFTFPKKKGCPASHFSLFPKKRLPCQPFFTFSTKKRLPRQPFFTSSKKRLSRQPFFTFSTKKGCPASHFFICPHLHLKKCPIISTHW